MKRKIAGLFTALMVLSFGMTAFAANSPSAEEVEQQQKVEAAVKGAETVKSETEGATVAVPDMNDPEVAAKVNEAVAEAAKVDAKADVKAVIELSYDGEIPEGGVSITLAVPAVKAGDNVLILHWNGSAWEKIDPTNVADGKITATFTSFSPVAVVVLPEKAGDDNNNGDDTNKPGDDTNTGDTNKPGDDTNTGDTNKPGNDTNKPGNNNGPSQTPNNGPSQTPGNGPGQAPTPEGKSPKTGAEAGVLPVLAALFAAGVVFCGKKVKVNA